MAGKVFIVLVLLSIQQIFARDCSNVESILNCNECIRCGGNWCSSPTLQSSRCSLEADENWCPDYRERLTSITDVSIPGDAITPLYSEKTALVGVPTRIPIVYTSSVEQKIKVEIVNTTQNFDFDVNKRTMCNDINCTTTIEGLPGQDFCSPTGRALEYVNVKLNVDNFSEDVFVKYHVPCACQCSDIVDKNSVKCNGKGDYRCGVCFCQNGWSGEFCDKKICEDRRGDLPCSNPARNNVDCSGNGYCDPCETCVCYSDREGSQYFDANNYCTDICMTTSNCDECLRHPTPGFCSKCELPIKFQNYNKTIAAAKDAFNRNVWVRCNETLPDGCYVEYVAMRDENDEINVMVTTLCAAVTMAYAPGGVNVTVPVIIGVLALVAASAAVAGFMMYKNRTPPLPLTDPQYTNIGAEDCTGENPLYKPPTSSFKNPTYGKW